MPLGASWRPLGGLVEALGGLLGAFFRHLKPSESTLACAMSYYVEIVCFGDVKRTLTEPFISFLGACWSLLEASWGPPGASWKPLGSLVKTSLAILTYLNVLDVILY